MLLASLPLHDPQNKTSHSHRPFVRLALGALLKVCILSAFWPDSAIAAPGDCIATSSLDIDIPSSGVIDYRISIQGASTLSGVSEEEFFEAVIAAADTWNEQSNSVRFRFLGTTDKTDLPQIYGSPPLPTEASCDAGYSIVTVADDNDWDPCTNAAIQQRCATGSGSARARFRIIVRRRMLALSEDWPWSVGAPVTSCPTYEPPSSCSWNDLGTSTIFDVWHPEGFQFCRTDLQQAVAHEFGHATDMAHPTTHFERSVMVTTRWNSIAQRDLYQYDKTCAVALTGFAPGDPNGFRRYVASSTIGAETLVTPTSESFVRTLTTGITRDGAGWAWSYGFGRNGYYRFRYTPGGGSAVTNTVELPKQFDTSPSLVLYREFDEANDRLFFVEHKDDPQPFEWDSTHPVRYERSSDKFAGTDANGGFHVCDSMSGFETCSDTTRVTSPYPVAVAWDDGSERSVTAWVAANKQDDTTDRQVKVAVGLIPNQTLPISYDLGGARSAVGPGLACRDGAPGDDCILAYVDPHDSLGRIHVRKFHNVEYPAVFPTHYKPTQSGGPYLVATWARTAQRIAAFYHDGYWWLAFRSKTAGQNIVVVRSSNGLTWSLFSSNLGHSSTGPTAASYWQGNNMIGTLR